MPMHSSDAPGPACRHFLRCARYVSGHPLTPLTPPAGACASHWSVRLRLVGCERPLLVPPPHAGPPGLGRLGSLISDRRAECQPCDGWKDTAWAMTPGISPDPGRSFTHSLTHIYMTNKTKVMKERPCEDTPRARPRDEAAHESSQCGLTPLKG